MRQPRISTEGEVLAATRRARYFLYVLGAFFTLLALACDLMPQLAGRVPEHAAKVCALFAIALLGVGRFATERWVRRCAGLLTGWP